MKKLSFLFVIFSFFLNAQSKKENIAAINKFQNDLNKEYLNPKESPLRGDNLRNFKKHPFFSVLGRSRMLMTKLSRSLLSRRKRSWKPKNSC